MLQDPVILVVDDEEAIVDIIGFHLRKWGFRVIGAPDGETALRILWNEKIDLIILDLMLPGTSGFQLLKHIRKEPGTESLPVIVLSARSCETDKIICFEMGADDFIAKPFSNMELLARVRAILNRRQGFANASLFENKQVSINFKSHNVKVLGRPVSLSPKEFSLLHVLYQRKNTVIGREQLKEAVWGADSPVDNHAVDVNITRMREKLGKARGLVKTIKGFGYLFEC